MTGADRQPYDVHLKLDAPIVTLAFALDKWAARDDTRPQPEVRAAANTAMDAIDGMLRELHQMRSRLTGEIYDSDEATILRADALLQHVRQLRQETEARDG